MVKVQQSSEITEPIEYNHPQREEEGIIEVIKGHDERIEEELLMLKKIQKFEPFIKKGQEKGYFLDQLLGLKLVQTESTNNEIPKEEEDSSLLLNIFLTLQTHIKEQMRYVNSEQRSLLRHIAYVDELSSRNYQSVINAMQQAKIAADKISEASIIKKKAEQVKEKAEDIFKTLSALEQYLDPEDRISVNNENTKWPELSKLRAQALRPLQQPPFERYISSASDLTIPTTATTLPVSLEPVIIKAGELPIAGKSDGNEGERENEGGQLPRKQDMMPSSAIDHLRELSSRSTTSNME
ncbi:MAG: hypothetical protein EXX96DRAFT_616439 [Benjaminiella poitrasii]|nr:MAG: hypothetical protein EXX96DRAFT_616439 [Benjaminiella poitrasii]